MGEWPETSAVETRERPVVVREAFALCVVVGALATMCWWHLKASAERRGKESSDG